MLACLVFRRWRGQEKQVVEGSEEGRGLKRGVEEEDPPVMAGSGTPKTEAGLIWEAQKEVLPGGEKTSAAGTTVGAERLKG